MANLSQGKLPVGYDASHLGMAAVASPDLAFLLFSARIL
jgi:hypothetical protein